MGIYCNRKQIFAFWDKFSRIHCIDTINIRCKVNYVRTRTYSSSIAKDRYRVLFFGSDNFSLASLRALVNEQKSTSSVIDNIEVVSSPDQRTGRNMKHVRKTLVKQFAEEFGLIVHDAPQKSLDDWKPPSLFDLGIVVSFGYFIPANVLKTFSRGAINVHPSLLPMYRGASPIQYSILNGDVETGITIQELHHEVFDAGRILRQIKMPIPPRSTYKSLESILAEQGAELLIDTIKDLDVIRSKVREQDSEKVTYARKIQKEMSYINWSDQTAEEIERLHRAISHQYALRTTFLDRQIQLTSVTLPPSDSHPLTTQSPLFPGTLFYDKNSKILLIACKDNSFIACSRVKMELKKDIDVKDWVNGYDIVNGVTRFGI
ncbi:7696_t:CDS:2 [Paraglomus occultum]|uniref:Methionyl-tRNA formyltransferase, mitochondrial n=1 Tax=Paraglomus occultum TaxID=144539 RepID=A0A9N8ZMP4_9GLOM|nr:7696_t:CDS:2 [Paraglomus occultum]